MSAEQEEINPVILGALESIGKELACSELPIVEKHLKGYLEQLKAKGFHPFKISVVEWLIKGTEDVQNILGCNTDGNATS